MWTIFFLNIKQRRLIVATGDEFTMNQLCVIIFLGIVKAQQHCRAHLGLFKYGIVYKPFRKKNNPNALAQGPIVLSWTIKDKHALSITGDDFHGTITVDRPARRSRRRKQHYEEGLQGSAERYYVPLLASNCRFPLFMEIWICSRRVRVYYVVQHCIRIETLQLRSREPVTEISKLMGSVSNYTPYSWCFGNKEITNYLLEQQVLLWHNEILPEALRGRPAGPIYTWTPFLENQTTKIRLTSGPWQSSTRRRTSQPFKAPRTWPQDLGIQNTSIVQ